MIVDRYSVKTVRISDIYFRDDESLPPDGADIVRLIQSREKAAGAIPFRSPLINLGAGEEAIFKNFPKTLRYDIRRAETRDGCHIERISTPSDDYLVAFATDYSRFAARKALPSANEAKLRRLRSSIILSSAHSMHGVVWHVYLSDTLRLRLLYSAVLMTQSGDHQTMARINKQLHWDDIKMAGSTGHEYYDFGGCNLTDPALRGIDDFKMRFASEVETTFNAVYGLTMKGRLAIATSGLIGKPLGFEGDA